MHHFTPRRRSTRSVPMLVYHKVGEIPDGTRHPELCVPPARFAKQLAMLRRLGFHTVSIADYLAYRRGESALPRRPVVITFDDGYRSNYDVAFPLLADADARATIFVVSDLLGATNVWDADEPQEPLLRCCQIREMQRAGVEFQSHTRTHARLTMLAPQAALCELRTSRLTLEQLLGAPVDAIAYPWGAHDETVLRIAEDAGYAAGAIVRRRTNFDVTPMLALRRIPVWRSTSLRGLAWDLARLPWRGE